MANGITVTGHESVTKAYATVQRSADASEAFARIGGIVVSGASANAPKWTGALAGSLMSSPTGPEVTISSFVIYAGVQEWGWPDRGIIGTRYTDKAIYGNMARIRAEVESQVTAGCTQAQNGG